MKYIVIDYITPEGGGVFQNRADRMVELYDSDNHIISHTVDEGLRSRASVKPWLNRYYLRSFGDAKIPGQWAMPDEYGRSLETTAFKFNGPNAYRIRVLDMQDEDGANGLIAVTREDFQSIPVPHPIYPEVRSFWLDEIRSFIDAGVDGIDLRIDNHSAWISNPDLYGYNPPIDKAYQQVVGRSLLVEPFDREVWRRVQGDAYSLFVAAVHELCAARGVQLHLHVNAGMGADITNWSLNNVPQNFEWQWEKWIKDGYVDAISLKLLPFPWGSRAGQGIPFMECVIALAKANGVMVNNHARLDAWWLISKPNGRTATASELETIRDKMRFVLDSQLFDGMILYEAFDFIKMDPISGKIEIAPEMEGLLDDVRQRNN